MRSKTRCLNNVPPADVILGLLNDEPRARDELILFYEGYIQVAATEPVYTEEGIYNGMYLNEDLMQEIHLALLKAIPPLKRNIFKRISSENHIILVFQTDTKDE